MGRKKFFLVIDTETTQTNSVADFGAVVIDRQGRVQTQCGVLVREYYMNRDKHPLFHTKDVDPLWGAANLPARYAAYDEMVRDGRRMIASKAAVNKWLGQVAVKYAPTVTAYNWAFDKDKLTKSGLHVDIFEKSFCLWHAAAAKWGNSREFRQFVLDNHLFGKRTKTGCMTMLTNAEVMARFILKNPEMEDEPHTALEDALDYEVPILKRLLEVCGPSEYMNAPPYSYRQFQARDWFTPK